MVQKRVCTSAQAMVDYQERHLSNGDYHLEEGKIQGEFIGALADQWGLGEKAILRDDSRFRSFAELDISTLSARISNVPASPSVKRLSSCIPFQNR
jgi:hypothetical protein